MKQQHHPMLPERLFAASRHTLAVVFFILTLMSAFSLPAHADVADLSCLDITASSIGNVAAITTMPPAPPGEGVRHTVHFSVVNLCPDDNGLPPVSNITIAGEDVLTCENGDTIHLTTQITVPYALASAQAYAQDITLMGSCRFLLDGVAVASILPSTIAITLSASGIYGSAGAIAPEVTYGIWPTPDSPNCPRETTMASASLAGPPRTNPGCVVLIMLSKTLYPQTTQHIMDARAAGKPTILTLDRASRLARGVAARAPYPLCGKDQDRNAQDRDEYPPAIALEGGAGADVRCIRSSDNRGAGAVTGSSLDPYADGTRFRFVIIP